MGELSENINVRVNIETKTKIAEEAYKLGIRPSSYIIIALQEKWSGIEDKDLKEEELKEALFEIEDLKAKISQQDLEFKEDYKEYYDLKKTKDDQALRIVNLQNENQKFVENTAKAQTLIEKFTSPILKEVFHYMQQKYPEDIKSPSDVTNHLCQQYYQQFINEHQYV
jgi:prophage DNA circulation protein